MLTALDLGLQYRDADECGRMAVKDSEKGQALSMCTEFLPVELDDPGVLLEFLSLIGVE